MLGRRKYEGNSISIINCKYKYKSICLLRSLYIAGNRNHVPDDYCKKFCGESIVDKINMINKSFHLTLNEISTPNEAKTLQKKYRKEFLQSLKPKKGLSKKLTQGMNLTKSIYKREKAKLKHFKVDRTETEAELLHAICKQCPSDKYNPENDECNDCYCKMKTKTTWATERCIRGHFDEYLKSFGEFWWFEKYLISVIIPAKNENLLNETIHDLFISASYPSKIEMIVLLDCWDEEYKEVLDHYKNVTCKQYPNIKTFTYHEPAGQRIAINYGVAQAQGKYIMKIDAHCKMSDSWDYELITDYKNDTIRVPILKGMGHGTVLDNFFIRPDYSTIFYKSKKDYIWNEQFEMMSLSGGVWFTTKELYDYIGGFEETLGHWGNCGSEMALRTWLTGKRLVSARNVICEHYYKSGHFNYDTANIHLKTDRIILQHVVENNLLKNQMYDFNWLQEKFNSKEIKQ